MSARPGNGNYVNVKQRHVRKYENKMGRERDVVRATQRGRSKTRKGCGKGRSEDD
jgi:hypothetical protein